MKKAIVAVLVAVGMLVGCATNTGETGDGWGDEKRFVIVHHEPYFYIVKDRKTGVHYLLYDGTQEAGITPLLDENGRVVVRK